MQDQAPVEKAGRDDEALSSLLLLLKSNSSKDEQPEVCRLKINNMSRAII